ncbi:MAG: hypothetical protein ACTSPM_01055 [Candidatus Heimdallarchaeota archaeon]
MKPSERFAKKVWRKPPKKDPVGHKVPAKSGLGKCAICKKQITSTKRRLMKDNTKPTKSHTKTNRPYGGYLCTKCFRKQIIETNRASTEA